MGTSLFKANYSYKLVMLLILKQAKEKVKKFIDLYKNIYKIAKLVQE